VSPTTIGLGLLVFALVATRLWEEGRWRTGRMSDRTAALLVVGRLPILVGGFFAIVGQGPLVALGGAALGALAGAALYSWVLGRLRRAKSKAAGRG
jgi:hypothetical protein